MPARTRARPKRRRAKRKRARRKQIAHLQQRMFQLKIPDEQVRIFLKNWSGHRPAFFVPPGRSVRQPGLTLRKSPMAFGWRRDRMRGELSICQDDRPCWPQVPPAAGEKSE